MTSPSLRSSVRIPKINFRDLCTGELRKIHLPRTRVNTGIKKEQRYSGLRLSLGQPLDPGKFLQPVLGYAASDRGVCATAL